MQTLHLIGNAHLDPVWLWRWQEGFAEIKATFRSALDRMQEFPGFTFTCACAGYYKWVEENEPAMFDEIKQRVAEGRWVIAGGWWIQPDCNLPSGESFARHALYAQRYFYEKFGHIARVGYNVDSFGHNGMLPQLLKKSGMDSYVMMRPGAHEKDLPGDIFWWESADGSRVLTCRLSCGYGTCWGTDLSVMYERLADRAEEQGIPLMLFYGVGNHGGGPTVAELHRCEAMIAKSTRTAIRYSSPDGYFKDLRALGGEYPVVRGDLQHHASGCYSTTSDIKALNRKAECRLVSAEKFMTIANEKLKLPYRSDLIKKAWEDVLFNQFHDIMGGCSIPEAYDDAREFYGEALKLGGDMLNASLQKLSWNIDTMGDRQFFLSKDFDWAVWEMKQGGAPVVVFNPLSWEVDAVVQLSKKVSRIEDDLGSPVALQHVRASRSNVQDMWDTLFRAAIPAFGWRVFRIFLSKEPEAPDSPRSLISGGNWLENDWLRLELDPYTGNVSRLYDKADGVEVFSSSGATPVVIDDECSDTWAHAVFEFRTEVGRFGDASVTLVEDGPLRSTLRATSRWGRSELRQDFSLWRDRPGVDVSVRLNWQEHHKMLKLSFPLNAWDCGVVYEIPYGALERPADGKEYPGQSWVDITGTLRDGRRYGLALANTTKYSYDALGSDLRLTAVRSAMYADHFGQRDGFGEFMDQGIQYFSYTLLPHCGLWQRSGIVRRTQELLNPAVAVLETFHKGSLPLRASQITIDQPGVIAAVLKQAEDGDALVLRCCETLGEPTAARINLSLAGVAWTAMFGPYEIKTFHISQSSVVEETNLLEGELP